VSAAVRRTGHDVREQLEEIYRSDRRALFTLAMCITQKRSLAEDAVHNAFLKLCRTRRRPSGDLRNYVFAAVRHAAIDLKKQNRGEIATDGALFEALPATSIGSDSPAEALERQERQALLMQAIESLDPASREAVLLKTHAGLTFEAIAEITGDRQSTVATRYRRALEKLEYQLRDKT
jgi:RNA polymerase sigma-70 factor (ECF subfamily)